MLRFFSAVLAYFVIILVSTPAANLALAQQSVPARVVSPALPIRQGYYTEGRATCAAAMADFTIGMFVRPRRFEFNDVFITIQRVTQRASGEFVVAERMQGEGGNSVQTSTVRIINPNSFSRMLRNSENPKGPPTILTYRFCSATPPSDWNF